MDIDFAEKIISLALQEKVEHTHFCIHDITTYIQPIPLYAIYNHQQATSMLKAGNQVSVGQQIAVLGTGNSSETIMSDNIYILLLPPATVLQAMSPQLLF